ncbi:MAG: hypothetical protein H6739_05245 [Alphaproteobacteria bacterium]|nr:hypothetical protein [Alphaproteobacteria bacterium]
MRRHLTLLLASGLLASALPGAPAYASPAEHFGFGAHAIGRGGAGVAMPGDAGSSLLNPAAMADREGSQFFFAYQLARFNFEPLPRVYWDADRDGLISGPEDSLQPQNRYDPADAMQIGLARDVRGWFQVGLAISMPRGRLLRLYTFDPSVPTYFMYRNRAHRYAVAASVAASPVRSLQLGAGVRVVSHSRLDVNFTLDGTVAGEPGEDSDLSDLVAVGADAHEIDFDLVPDLVPQLGLRWDLGELFPPLEGLAVGGTWRGEGQIPVTVNIDGQINAGAEDIGDIEPAVAVLVAKTQLLLMDHFLPRQARGGVAYTFRDVVSGYVDVDYTWWSRMALNVSHFANPDFTATLADLSELDIQDGNNLSGVVLRNTVGVRGGVDAHLPHFPMPGRFAPARASVRAGVGYEPSPLVEQTAETALLDSDRLLFAGGLGLDHAAPFALVEGPWSWDVFGQLHVLAPGTLQRPNPDTPRAGYPVDGAEIPIGGRIFTAGLQWSLDY